MSVLWAVSLLFLPLAAVAGKPVCFGLQVPIHVSLPVNKYDISPFKDNYEATAFLVGSIARTANASALIAGQAKIDRSYNISLQYCEPAKGVPKNGVVQVLTHGLGFDKSYWDFDLNGNDQYNYIASATAAGYATLSYDRLGVGDSTRANPYLDVQASTQVALLAQISSLLRTGHLSPRIPAAQKLVHVGHSFGSLLTNALVASTPELSDAVVLTGFSHNFSWGNLFQICWGFQLARLNDPTRFSGFESGYLTWGDEFDNQCAAFSYPFFDREVLGRAEKSKAPFAIAELVSFGLTPVAAPGFAGPVLMLSGEHDLSFCGGQCRGVLDAPDSPSAAVFPKASPLASYVHPNAGHALNVHRNATAAYSVIFDFLKDNGL